MEGLDGDYILEDFFSDEKFRLTFRLFSISRDIHNLQTIYKDQMDVVVEFDGLERPRKDYREIIIQLAQESADLEEQLVQNDTRIFKFFKALELKTNRPPRLESLYEKFLDYDDLGARCNIFFTFADDFKNYYFRKSQSNAKFQEMSKLEGIIKTDMQAVLNDLANFGYEPTDAVQTIQQYLSADRTPFEDRTYQNNSFGLLSRVKNHYPEVYLVWVNFVKAELFQYQADLV
jgi:hypothetical protein